MATHSSILAWRIPQRSLAGYSSWNCKSWPGFSAIFLSFSYGRDWLRGKLGLVLMGGAMLSKSVIQFSVDGCCVPSLLFDLRPHYGGGNDNGDLFQKVSCMLCWTPCSQPCSRPPSTHGSARDSWTLMGMSGSVSCGITVLSPGSWWAQGFFCAFQYFVSAVLSKFWWPYNDVNGDLPVGLMPHPGLLHLEPLPLQEFTAHPYIHRRHSNTVLS